MFTHLHVHTEYSLLDGLGRIPALVDRAKRLGMDSLAITDHGALYGIIDFYLACREAGIKPILGGEFYVAPGSRHGRSPSDKNPYHLILLAKNNQGYKNLLQLSTLSHLEGFYYKPRVDKELLARYGEGLIALSACIQGEVSRYILEGREEAARQAAREYQGLFGEFYLELQEHKDPNQERVNRGLVALSRELGIPLVATNDVHYLEQKDAPIHDLLLCIQTNTSIHDPKRIKMPDDSFYLRSAEEMARLFPSLPEALENSGRIAEMCQVELEFSKSLLPAVEVPPGKTPQGYVEELAWEGARERYGDLPPEVEERLRYELEVIKKTNFANYFLVVWDIIAFTRSRGILFGVRGSAAASLVLYCLKVTSIDPLAYGLVFERFLNIERKEMPDIDLDFQDDRRDEVIAYVAGKYGQERVAQIITFGTLGAKAALRDTGRALGLAYSDVDRVARLVPPGFITLAQALEENPALKAIYQQDAAVKELVDRARELEGTSRHASTHAAGVVISQEPLTGYLPLQRPVRGEGIPMAQFAMEPIARIGLLKMDFLGLANLTILAKTREIVLQTRGIDLDLQNLPLNDPRAFALLAAGETTGIFQLEGGGMRRYIKELKPSSLNDVAAMIALYRPGPMQHVSTFIQAKHGREPIRFPHPALADILKETYGVIVYQDQVLRIVQTFAGYSLGEADLVRKAMGKKIPEVMRQERGRFIEGARKKGFSPEVASQVFDLIEPFAGYAFNKAHSVSYAMIAYQTAYLKANYPTEYMTAILILHAGQLEKVAANVGECHRLGISVLPPDVNHSDTTFSIEPQPDGIQAIRFGLADIKNVGEGGVKPIVEAREKGGPFASLEDFCRRSDLRGLNKRMLESLIKAGALDSLGPRGALLAKADHILSLAHQEQRLRELGQATMFDLWGEKVPLPWPGLELGKDKAIPAEKVAWEKELLGVALSPNPLKEAARSLAKRADIMASQLDAGMDGQTIALGGMVTSVLERFTKKGKPFITAFLEDLSGNVEVTVWPEVYESTRELWREGLLLIVRGRVRVRGEEVGVVCQGAELYKPEGKAKPSGRLVLRLEAGEDGDNDKELLQRLISLLVNNPGDDPVLLVIEQEGKSQTMTLRPVNYAPELKAELIALLGEAGVEWKEG